MSSEFDDNYLKRELYDLIRKDSQIFDFIQSSSLDGMWYWDLENPSEEWMSERFWTTLGYDPKKMPHQSGAWQDIINQEDLEEALLNFTAHCENPERPYEQVARYQHSDGSTVWIRCRGLAIRDNNGKPIRMLGTHTDITSLKKTEESLAENNNALISANDELTSFAFAASHDIQAPIRNIKGLLNILQEDAVTQLDENNSEVLAMALAAAQRLTELTTGILQFAESGSRGHIVKVVDCQALLANITLDLNVDLTLNHTVLQIGDMPKINAIEIPTRQLFQNLIGNAVKFHRQDEGHTPRITVTAERYNEGWKFKVVDNGIGIAENNLQRLFKPFTRLNLSSEFSGSGLGLTLCQRAVRKHGGEIWVESTLGEGTTFHFTYPHCALDE